jgi:predicted amidohydrolase
VLTIDGWRVGLGICKDTRMPEHLGPTLGLGIDLYAAGLVHAPDEVDELEQRAQRIIATAGVPVAFASAAGYGGAAYPQSAGHSAIWDRTGACVARADDSPGTVVLCRLVLGRLRARPRTRSARTPSQRTRRG